VIVARLPPGLRPSSGAWV